MLVMYTKNAGIIFFYSEVIFMANEINHSFQPFCYINKAPCMKLLDYIEIADAVKNSHEDDSTEE